MDEAHGGTGSEDPEEGNQLGLDDRGPAVVKLQKRLNELSKSLGVSLVVADGFFGPETAACCEQVVYLLGLQEDEALPDRLSPELRRLLDDPRARDEVQLARAERRQRFQGRQLTADDLIHGVQVLDLIGGWDEWVCRRSDTVRFSAEDEKVFVRKSTVHFTLPTEMLEGRPHPDRPFAVPLRLMGKWKLPRFHVRDEGGASLALLSRAEHGPIAAAMLVAFAYQTYFGSPLPTKEQRRSVEVSATIPAEVVEDLCAIANEDPPIASEICAKLGSRVTGIDLSPDDESSDDDAKAVLAWRRTLATSETFMELAYELADNFLLMVWCPPPFDRRRVIKLSYDQLSEAPRRVTLRERWRDALTTVKERLGVDVWPRSNGRGASIPVGHVTISVTSAASRLFESERAEGQPCAEVRIRQLPPQEGRAGESHTHTLHSDRVLPVSNLPIGEYELTFDALPGFHLQSDRRHTVTVSTGDSTRVTVECRQMRAAMPSSVVAGPPTPAASLLRRLSIAFAWRSQTVHIYVRIGDGGSYHFEFEAPPGLQITRSKLADDRRGVLERVVASSQRTHLYVPSHRSQPASGWVQLNLRPRGETVLRSAMLTGALAALAIVGVALHWQLSGRAGPTGVALLLAVPGGLSAYVSQGSGSRVTDARLFGLRVVALLPGLAGFVAAGLVLFGGRSGSWPLVTLWVDAGVAVLVAILLIATSRLTARPREQRLTRHDQGPGFEPQQQLTA